MSADSERTKRLLRLSLGLGVASLVFAALALADGATLHEYVPNLGSGDDSSIVSNRGAEPAAIVYGGELLRAPSDGPIRSSERPIRANETSSEVTQAGLPPSEPAGTSGASATSSAGGDPSESEPRRASFSPDRVTALHGAVPYFGVFSPSISPYKRMSALDTVELDAGGVPILVAGHGAREAVPIESPGTMPSDNRARDRFWGSVVLDFTTGRVLPFPSVSPESRILSLRTNPEVPLHLERDGGGNFFAVLDATSGAAALGEVRVVFLTDAPRGYFGFSSNQRFPAVPVDALADEVSPLPAPVLRSARAFAAELGLSRASRFDEALRTLVTHFRSFEESDTPPSDTGDVYLDLARGMLGVCRHRAYAFVITASALGISSRFVHNEAHAWVEVHLPESGGWLRVDLGGSAVGLRNHRPDEAPTYDPRLEDPFPRPAAYQEALAQAASRRGVSDASSPGRPRRGEEGADDPSASASGGSQRGRGARSSDGEPVLDEAGEPSASAPSALDPGPDAADEAALPTRRPVTLRVAHASREAFRGQLIEVSGSASSEGEPTGGLRVEVFLRGPRGDRLLGAALTDENGAFHGSFGVPPDTLTGEHRLVVSSPGDVRHLAAVAP